MKILLSHALKRKLKDLVRRYTLKGVIHALVDFCQVKDKDVTKAEQNFANNLQKAWNQYLEDRKQRDE